MDGADLRVAGGALAKVGHLSAPQPGQKNFPARSIQPKSRAVTERLACVPAKAIWRGQSWQVRSIQPPPSLSRERRQRRRPGSWIVSTIDLLAAHDGFHLP